MTEAIIDVEEILVTTGPAVVDVQVDFGQKGEVGTVIYTSIGNPNDYLTEIDANLLDLSINVSPEDPGFSYMYQWKANSVGVVQWEPILKLNPSVKPQRFSKLFENGSAIINLYIDEISDSDSIATFTRDNFSVQVSVENQNPIALSISLGEIVQESIEERLILPLTINASELSGGSWVDLDGQKNVHIMASVV